MSIQVEKITKSFGSQKALNEISFSIKKGEITGFLGPNGAGKTTMMRILTTYSNADSGFAKVNGYDVVTESKNARSSIGYLPEHNPLYLEMFVREYLSFHASLYRIPSNRIEQVVEETGPWR